MRTTELFVVKNTFKPLWRQHARRTAPNALADRLSAAEPFAHGLGVGLAQVALAVFVEQ